MQDSQIIPDYDRHIVYECCLLAAAAGDYIPTEFGNHCDRSNQGQYKEWYYRLIAHKWHGSLEKTTKKERWQAYQSAFPYPSTDYSNVDRRRVEPPGMGRATTSTSWKDLTSVGLEAEQGIIHMDVSIPSDKWNSGRNARVELAKGSKYLWIPRSPFGNLKGLWCSKFRYTENVANGYPQWTEEVAEQQ